MPRLRATLYIMEKILISRHENTTARLKAEFNLGEDVPVVVQASAEDVRGKHVFGNLPLNLAAMAKKVTAPTLDIPKPWRGRDLNDEEFDKFYKGCHTYVVDEIAD